MLIVVPLMFIDCYDTKQHYCIAHGFNRGDLIFQPWVHDIFNRGDLLFLPVGKIVHPHTDNVYNN